MKKILIGLVMFVLGVCAVQAFGQEYSVLVKPQPYSVRVDVVKPYTAYRVESHRVLVQPAPVVVTPHVIPPPPKPIFGTPFRDKVWRWKNPWRIHYHVRPYQPQE